jgi:hypothetical protein
MDGEGNLFMTARLQEMIMTGVGSLDLNFSSNTVDFQTFDITFVYNTLEIKSIATERVRALPVSVSQPIACLPAQILLNGNLAVAAPSGVLTDIRVLQAGQPVGALVDGVFVIPSCEDAQWELVDDNDGVLGAGVIASGEGAIIVAPNAAYSLEDTIGGVLSSGAILSGGSEIIVAPDASWTLEDTFGAQLDSGTIVSGGSEIIVAPDATVERDGLPFSIVPSGGTIDVPSDTYQILSDTVSNINYIGISPTGTATSGQWTINRITVALDGTITVATAVGPWDDRYTLIYT